MASTNKPEYNGFQKGDIAVRKGRLCVITKINFTVTPPDVTVKMQDNGAVVGTEFSRLEIPTDEDMLKMPMNNHRKQSSNNNNRKRSYFDAFFEERKQKLSKPCDTIPQITSHSTAQTSEDLLKEPPLKRTKVSHNFAQGWFCSACTVENTEMDSEQCYLCATPRTFEEKIKYPSINPVILPRNNTTNSNTESDDAKESKEEKQENKGKTLTFITWNVWFNEELRVIERMQAIGAIIDKHKADIVCFQEITPLILDILQSGQWYTRNGFQCTILPSHGSFNGLRYYNAIMTRHEFIRDSIQFKAFANSQMGRHLIVTPIKLRECDTVICAATTHLESPVGPWSGGKSDKFSSERKAQLKESLETLDSRNECVIFGGDMNWCRQTKTKENDGDMSVYLGQNWKDCFGELHPNENGYTYDAKSNGMLSGYLMNRLDRILYRNRGRGQLRLKQCFMIGREAIPNLSYVKTFKRKNGNEEKILPVLPSDHYGLCAQFELV